MVQSDSGPSARGRSVWPSTRRSCQHGVEVRHVCPNGLPEADREAVPTVDGDDRERQGDLLVGAELASDLLVDIVWSPGLGKHRERLGPGERSPFAWREYGCFMPYRDEVKSLL